MADECELENHSREISRNIPDEVFFEDILVRLPVKSLIAYKSVCKTWLYTIESRSFIEAHRRRHCCDYSDQIVFTSYKHAFGSASLIPRTQSFSTGLTKMTYRPLDVMLPLEMTQDLQPDAAHTSNVLDYWIEAIRVLGPIRTTSIYCVLSYLHKSAYKFKDFLGVKIAICNPAIRDYKLASPFPSEEMPRLLKLAAKQFSRAQYGFGVAADGDYKVVVVIVCTPQFGSFFSYVYSMRQGTWKMIVDSENGMLSRLDLRDKQGFPYIHDNSLELCPQVFLNGCWHWSTRFKDKMLNVLTFNVDNEEFKLVWGPPSYRERMLPDDGIRTCSIVSVLNGRLALLDQLDVNVINVWMMMEYGDEESWINVWRVNLKSYPYHIKTLVGITYSLREDSNGGIQIERVLFQNFSNELVSYDEFGAVKQLGRFNTSSCIFWNTLGISAYSETLERLSPSKRIAGRHSEDGS